MGSGGKGGKSYTIGHKYLMGQHHVICQTPIDAVMAFEFGDREAWNGYAMDEQIRVVKPDLYGGKSREGGVSGAVDVLGGGPEQGVNDYLDSELDGLVPAFRGVVSLVFRQFYWGNNPYIKPFRVRIQNVFSTYGQWLPGLAPVNAESSIENTAIYLALDNSGSMIQGTRLATMQVGIKNFLRGIPFDSNTPVKIASFDVDIDESGEWFTWNASALAEAEALVDRMMANGFGTDFDAGVSQAPQFFADADANNNPNKGFGFDFISVLTTVGSALTNLFGEATETDALGRFVIFVTDGKPSPAGSAASAAATLAGIDRVRTFGVNIELYDTTSTEIISDFPVPVILDGDAKSIATSVASRLSGACDLNFAHMMRDVLIAPSNDGSGAESEIGDSFEIAARTFFDEGMGGSLFWNNTGDVDEFKKKIEDHANCAVYPDRITGLWEISPIRPDYVFDDLFVADASIITDWPTKPNRPDQAELPNQITLIYTRRDTGEPTPVTLTNIAGVQARAAAGLGGIKNEKVTLEGITFDDLANVICQRELVARTTPITRGAVRLAYLPPDLNIGSPFIVHDPRVKISNMVVRILEIDETDGKDNSIMVRFAEDVFGQDIADGSFGTPEEVDTSRDIPLPPELTYFDELPYYEVVRIAGELDTADNLAVDPDLGLWGATCTQPNLRHLEAYIVRDDDGTFISVASTNFAPAWVLTSALTKDPNDNTFTADKTGREGEIALNELIQINGEIMRVDVIVDDGTTATFTVGRGVLDTPPENHGIGDTAFGWQDTYGSDLVQYTAGETLDIKILPATRIGALGVFQAETETLEFDSRAARPYPVGKLQWGGTYLPAAGFSGTQTATWVHRNRIIQTTDVADDFDADSIGPEVGVVYTAELRYRVLWADVYAIPDVYGVRDVYVDPDPIDTFAVALAGAQDLTVDFTPPSPDVYDATDVYDTTDVYQFDFTERFHALDFAVTVTRDGYDNRTSSTVQAQPLLPPTNFTGYA